MSFKCAAEMDNSTGEQMSEITRATLPIRYPARPCEKITFHRKSITVKLTNINNKGRKRVLHPPYRSDGIDWRDNASLQSLMKAELLVRGIVTSSPNGMARKDNLTAATEQQRAYDLIEAKLDAAETQCKDVSRSAEARALAAYALMRD